MALFPRFQLFEIEDMAWCPAWLREYTHRSLHQMWNTVGLNRTSSTAAQACDILVSKLPRSPDSYTFVDACAGAGGPTPLLERNLNSRLASAGKPPAQFLLADLYPDWKAWKKITAGSDMIRVAECPMDATKTVRYVGKDTRECRLFNLCFHHFDDGMAANVLKGSIEGSEAFVIFELTQRNIPALLNTSLVVLSPFLCSLLWFWWSPLHMIFTYLIPVVPLFFAWDGYVSCIRTRTPDEIRELIKTEESAGNLDCTEWTFHSGQTRVLPPFGNLYWFIGVKKA